MSSVDDYRVGVVNEGPYEPQWAYDSKVYHYRASTPEMMQAKKPIVRWIPLTIAYEHWAVQINGNGKLERATDVKGKDPESQFSHRVSVVCKKQFYPEKDSEGTIIRGANGAMLGSYSDDQAMKEWFTNKVHFRLRRMPEYEEELVT